MTDKEIWKYGDTIPNYGIQVSTHFFSEAFGAG